MFLATLFFLAHLVSSIFIVINVIITITNVAGFMHFWGLVGIHNDSFRVGIFPNEAIVSK